MAIEIYKNKDVLAGKISLKTAPRAIIIKGSDEDTLFKAVDLAPESGYRIVGAYKPHSAAIRIILERL